MNKKMKQEEMAMSKQTKKLSEEPQEVDSELKNIVEAALYASSEPLGIRKLINMFPDDAQPTKVDIQNVLLSLEAQCEHRGVELRRVGKGWRFQSKEKYATWLRKLGTQKPPRYSRALLETLAIIAYRQPVTRGDIEEIRGVGVSSDTIRTLEEREWVQQIGHRDVPGRPSLFGTTQAFLEYFNMTSLRELPELMDKRELGDIAKDMNLTLPMDGVQNEQEADQSGAEHSPEQGSETSAKIIELHPEEVAEQEFIEDAQPQDTEATSEKQGTEDEVAELKSDEPIAESEPKPELNESDLSDPDE